MYVVYKPHLLRVQSLAALANVLLRVVGWHASPMTCFILHHMNSKKTPYQREYVYES